MKIPDIHYKKLILVCTNDRDNGKACCKQRNSDQLYRSLKLAIAEIDPMIRVSQTSCLGNCLSGSIVVVMPDNIWLGDVKLTDVPEIVKMITGKNTAVDSIDNLLMDDEDFLSI